MADKNDLNCAGKTKRKHLHISSQTDGLDLKWIRTNHLVASMQCKNTPFLQRSKSSCSINYFHKGEKIHNLAEVEIKKRKRILISLFVFYTKSICVVCGMRFLLLLRVCRLNTMIFHLILQNIDDMPSCKHPLSFSCVYFEDEHTECYFSVGIISARVWICLPSNIFFLLGKCGRMFVLIWLHVKQTHRCSRGFEAKNLSAIANDLMHGGYGMCGWS